MIDGIGPDAPIVANERGGTQSALAYRFDLFPTKAAFVVAKVLDEGARKHGAENWRKIVVADHLNHALMHVYAYLDGDTQDEHLSHAACRLLFATELSLIGARCSRTHDQHEDAFFAAHSSAYQPPQRVHRYYIIQRPPNFAEHPPGASKIVIFRDKIPVDKQGGQKAWGYAEYTRELSTTQIDQYGLVPAYKQRSQVR